MKSNRLPPLWRWLAVLMPVVFAGCQSVPTDTEETELAAPTGTRPPGPSFNVVGVGGLVATVSLPVTGRDVGIAFDGTRLYYNNSRTNLISFVPVGGPATVVVTVVAGNRAINLDAMAYDATRDVLWAVEHNTDNIYQVNKTTGAATFQFSAAGKCVRCIGTFRDGLAFDAGDPSDASDDAIWWSRDVDSEVFKLNLSGGTIESFNIGGAPIFNNSGIAVGGPNLYLANNGRDQIFRVNKITKALVDQFATPGLRPEDMECDPATFSPTEVMWVRQFEDPSNVRAFEIEPGTCGLGGEPPPTDRLDKFFDPEKGEGGQGPDPIVIGQQTTTQYSFAIDYVKSDPNTPQARLVETVPAEFDVVSATSDAGPVKVFLTSKGKGKSSTKITLDLDPGPQSARIDVVITTRLLPNGKRYKPTSCGLVFLNSGPVFVFEVDPETGAIRLDDEGNKVVLAGPSDILDILALEDPNNPDNDGDGLPNDEEARELGTDPCNADTDGDGVPDNVDLDPLDPDVQ